MNKIQRVIFYSLTSIGLAFYLDYLYGPNLLRGIIIGLIVPIMGQYFLNALERTNEIDKRR